MRRRAATLPYNNKHNNNTRARAASGRRRTSRDKAAGRAATAYRLPWQLAAKGGSSTEIRADMGEWMRRQPPHEKNIDKIVF